MEDLLQSNDPRLLLTLIGCAFVILLAWIMDGIASTQGADSAPARPDTVPQAPPEAAPPVFDTPERCDRPIGRYMDSPIFDTISIGGVEYRFDRVLAPGAPWQSGRGERCIAPGLIYLTR
jgi:hypothetical protein